MNAEQHHARLLRKKRPDAVQAPTRLVGMHHQRVGQQRAEHLELALPVPRQLIKQRVGLRLAEPEVLEEIEERTDFVERQADDINQVGDLGDDLQTVLAPAQDAGDLAVPVARAAIDLVRDQHRSTVFQPPHRPNMRQANRRLAAHPRGKRPRFAPPARLCRRWRRDRVVPWACAGVFSCREPLVAFLPPAWRRVRRPSPSEATAVASQALRCVGSRLRALRLRSTTRSTSLSALIRPSLTSCLSVSMVSIPHRF